MGSDFLKPFENIINFAKWVWELERTETGIINSIFMIILAFVVILTCIFIQEDLYRFILILFIIILLGMSVIAVMKIEHDVNKMQAYAEFMKKYQ